MGQGAGVATQQQLTSFARELRRAREESGLSMRELARLVDVGHTTVQQWEQGKAAPRPPRVTMLERILKLPDGALSRRLGYMPVDGEISSPRSRLTLHEALEADPRLKERDRRVITAVYRELVRDHEEPAQG
jgi:transcriptional regulator with XRE-family HTH domain